MQGPCLSLILVSTRSWDVLAWVSSSWPLRASPSAPTATHPLGNVGGNFFTVLLGELTSN